MAGNSLKSLMPHPQSPKRKTPSRLRSVAPIVVVALLLSVSLFSLPGVLAIDLKVAKAYPVKPDFPVTVDPANKVINEDPLVDALIEKESGTPLTAAADMAGTAFTWLASTVASFPLYQAIAGSDTVFVTIYPGYRSEEVATAFGSKLDWTLKQRQQFVAEAKTNPPTVSEGQFSPGTYAVSAFATPAQVQAIIYDQFSTDIADRYSTTTAQVVPVSEALTIASLLERETGGPEDIRIISGIIWNRLFVGMNLQIDATLQYAKANASKTGDWWPRVVPNDKYIKSAYNTYQHKGLPPGPIASPSVAAVIAALNPKQTDCLFYFHDSHGEFHCAATYKEHVALLKKYYGQGK